MLSLIAVKLLGIVWITLLSALGLWFPFVCLIPAHKEANSPRVFISRCYVRIGLIIGKGPGSLSLANCFSAGMLLTTALVHFFPRAFEQDATAKASCLSVWLLVGVLIPATLERCLDNGSHGHSHDGSSRCEHHHAQHRGSHSASPPPGGATIAAAATSGSSTTDGSCFRKKRIFSTATILVVLMCFHGMMEGMLLGFERSAQSLISATLPLSVHRFFDGLVIGVSMAKEYQQKMLQGGYTEVTSDGEVSTARTSAIMDASASVSLSSSEQHQRSFSLVRIVCTRGVIMWLALTPLTMLAVLVYSQDEGAAVHAAKSRLDGHAFKTLPVKGGNAKGNYTLAVAEAIGSGSFVYVSLSLLLQEELRGVKAAFTLLLGVATTFIMFTLSEHEH